MRARLALIAFLPLLACTPQQEETQTASTAAGEAVECVNLDQVISRRPDGENRISFFMTGGEVYVNELADHCPGLERLGDSAVVEIEATGSRVCRGDRIRVYDPVEAKNMPRSSFPQCRLGAFKPVPIVRINR